MFLVTTYVTSSPTASRRSPSASAASASSSAPSASSRASASATSERIRDRGGLPPLGAERRAGPSPYGRLAGLGGGRRSGGSGGSSPRAGRAAGAIRVATS